MRTAVWLLFAILVYLIFAGAVSPWVALPAPGNIGFTLLFLAFSTVHCAASAGWKRTGLFFTLAAVVSYVLEEIGVRTGWIYGPYHYSSMLGPKLADVPVLIPLAWFMMIYPSWTVARALLRGVDEKSKTAIPVYALIGAIVATGWDAIMDPVMSAGGNWIWEHGGSYFGVPLQNYFGWILTTFLVYVGAGLLWRNDTPVVSGKIFAALPIIVYEFYGACYMLPSSIPALQVVALFAMAMPGFLALVRTLLGRPESIE